MSNTNTFIPHRWDGSDDHDKIIGVAQRAGLKPSDRSVTKDNPLDSKGNYLLRDIYGKIDSASTVLVPARPSSTRKGSTALKEIEYAVKQGKTVIAVDTGATQSYGTYFKDNDIPIVPARKDSVAKAVKGS